jgi:hypothetical protein
VLHLLNILLHLLDLLVRLLQQALVLATDTHQFLLTLHPSGPLLYLKCLRLSEVDLELRYLPLIRRVLYLESFDQGLLFLIHIHSALMKKGQGP